MAGVWEFRSVKTWETSYVIADNSVTAVKRATSVEGAVRLYREGLIGLQGLQGASVKAAEELLFSGASDEQLEAAFPDAVAMLGLELDYEVGPLIGDRCETCHMNRYESDPILQIDRPQTQPPSLRDVEAFLQRVTSICPLFRLSNRIKWVEKQVSLANTAGLCRRWQDGWLEVELLFHHQEGHAVYDGTFETRAHTFNAEALAEGLVAMLQAFESPVDLPSKKMPVIFFEDEHVWLQYFTEHLSSRAWLSGRRPQEDFSKHLSIKMSRDKEHFIEGFDACGETLPQGGIALIDHGRWVRPYADRLAAARHNLDSTAAAWSAYDGVPGFGYMPLVLEDDRYLKLEELRNPQGDFLERAILVVTTGGGEFGDDGRFAAPLQLAYLMEKGCLIGRLPALMASGRAEEMFGRDFIGQSADEVLRGIGRRGVAMMLNVEPL